MSDTLHITPVHGVPDIGKVLEGSPMWSRASLAPGDHAEGPERHSTYVVMNLRNHSGQDLQNRSLFSVPCECLPTPHPIKSERTSPERSRELRTKKRRELAILTKNTTESLHQDTLYVAKVT